MEPACPIVTTAIAQLGPITRSENRRDVVLRLLALMENAARMGADLIVYPEAALTPFFPHWSVESEQELNSYFEAAMPNAAVQPLFDAARALKIGFHLGYAELDVATGRKRRFNTAILVGKTGSSIGKYERSICRAILSRGRAFRSRTWRSGISRSAILAFPSGTPSAGRWA